MRLEGKVAIVTGASVGIGRAIAERFLKEGAIVGICSTTAAKIEKTAEELKALGTVRAFRCNVAVKEDCEAVAKAMLDEFGRIDILVNNAGITRDAQFYKMTDEQFKEVMDVNLLGTYYMTKACILSMQENKYGRVVNLSSVSAFGNFGQTNYSASKAALQGFTRALAKEVGRFGITANALAPGFIETDMTAVVPDAVKEKNLASIPLRRAGQPEDVASAALFFCSEDGSYVTGQTLIVDGGWFCQ